MTEETKVKVAGEEPVQDTQGGSEELTEKTYKQSDVDNITEKVRENARKDAEREALEKLKSDEEFKAYQEWKQSQLTEQERIAEEKKALEEERKRLESEKEQAKRETLRARAISEMAKLGADTDAVDFVISLVKDAESVEQDVQSIIESKPYLLKKEVIPPAGEVKKTASQKEDRKDLIRKQLRK